MSAFTANFSQCTVSLRQTDFADFFMADVAGRRAQHRSPRILLTDRDIALKKALGALLQVGVLSSPDAILKAAILTGNHPAIGESGLRQFLSIDSRSMAPEAREPLERFLYCTALGRALRAPLQDPANAIDPLIGLLSTGLFTKPDGLEAEGYYFLYHGSYMRPSHFVVRLLEVKREREVGFAAIDTFRDNIMKPPFKILEAKGAVSFFGGRPNIIFHATDNRVGFGLLVSSETEVDGNKLHSFMGQLSGVTKAGKPFARYCIGIRVDGATADMKRQLVGETGLYVVDDLPPRHRVAIDVLATALPEPIFKDPISKHPGLISQF